MLERADFDFDSATLAATTNSHIRTPHHFGPRLSRWQLWRATRPDCPDRSAGGTPVVRAVGILPDMIRTSLALLASAVLVTTAVAVVSAAPADASTAALPTSVTYGAPVASIVDRHGTSFVLVQDELFYPVLYRRPSAGHSWIKTKIPNMPSNMRWHMFAPTANELWITAQKQASDGSDGDSIVSRSTNGGKTWTKANVSKFASGGSLGITSMAIVGNLVAYAHFSSGASSYIRLHPDLKGYDAWPAAAPAFPTGAEVAGNGTLMTWAYSSAKSWSITAGTHTVTVSFPCTLSSSFSGPTTAVGSSGLAMVGVCASSSHHVYVRNVTTRGVVGKATSLGTSTGTVLAAAGPGKAFAVAWALPKGGDWASAHSTTGVAWTRAKGELPIALGGTHTGNTGTFLVGNRYLTFGTDDRKTWAASLAATATSPAAPKKGVKHPLVLRIGTGVAVTALKVSHKALRKTGRLTVKVRTSVTDKVSVDATTTRKNSGYSYIYTDSESKTARAGHTVTITLHLHSGGVVIGGGGGSDLPLTDLKRGDSINFSVTTRNGLLQGVAKVV
jgi:hypothetical protein